MGKYNTTDLSPDKAFERHVFHRDQFAHYLRWTKVLKDAKIGETMCDFGCGQGNLAEVLYRNKFKQDAYFGFDIRDRTIKKASEKFANVPWIHFFQKDLCDVSGLEEFSQIQADRVASFEVIEHIGKQNAPNFLKLFKSCGRKGATYYLSTPNYDERVGAAGNHTFDSGDGRGHAVQEFTNQELGDLISEAGFEVVKKYGTFASIRDYKDLLSDAQLELFNNLREYYDTNLVSVIMAPMFPEQSRNCLWILKVGDE
jgi:2-polyprenyl-3-methyl-5-hydroxy-6-metoxy-1,4-benzoquinol methylase